MPYRSKVFVKVKKSEQQIHGVPEQCVAHNLCDFLASAVAYMA